MDHMGIDAAFISKESEIFDKISSLAEDCESWWACLGSDVAVMTSPFWRVVLQSDNDNLKKIEYSVIGLSPKFWGVSLLRRLHHLGVLRIVESAAGVFEPNVYGFRMGTQYATVIVSGWDSSVIFGPGIAAAVQVVCPRESSFAFSTESFLQNCIEMARLMTPMELDWLERRYGPTDPTPGGESILPNHVSLERPEPTEDLKYQIFKRDNFTCQACGAVGQQIKLQVDHVAQVNLVGDPPINKFQTLCETCNKEKGDQVYNFRKPNTELKNAPESIPIFNIGIPVFVDDPGLWEMFIRRTINFFYECGAIKEVLMGGSGDYFVHYTCDIELHEGNDPEWLEPLLGQWLANVVEKLDSRESRGTFEIDITVTGTDGAECFATSAKGESY